MRREDVRNRSRSGSRPRVCFDFHVLESGASDVGVVWRNIALRLVQSAQTQKLNTDYQSKSIVRAQLASPKAKLPQCPEQALPRATSAVIPAPSATKPKGKYRSSQRWTLSPLLRARLAS